MAGRDLHKFMDVLKEYSAHYSNYELQYMIERYEQVINYKNIPDVMRQIYDEIGAFSDDRNLYIGFLKLIKEHFDIDSNIVEVGGGVIPRLAKRISLEQKEGSIVVYDPRLYKEDTSDKKFELRKKRFDYDTDLTDKDLIIGLMPCEASEIIIRRACENNIDFIVGLCEGGHNAYDDYFDPEFFETQMTNIATEKIKQHNMGELVKTDLKDYGDPYPVLYNKRKK